MDAYDTIKEYYKRGFPLNDLRQFVGQIDRADYEGGAFRANEEEDEQWLVEESPSDMMGSMWSWVRGRLTGSAGVTEGGVSGNGTNASTNGPTGYTTLVPGT